MIDQARAQTLAFTALRSVAGTLILFHGVQKIFGLLTTHAQPEMFSQLWIGGVIELVGGTLVALGLFTRAAAILLSGTMAVAYFQFHWKLDVTNFRFLPIVNGGEEAALFCFVFLFFGVAGGGRASLDRILRTTT